MRHLLGIALIILACAVPAQAERMEFDLSGSERLSVDNHVAGISRIDDESFDAAKRAYLDIRWEAKARLGLLLGEPVISVHLKFDPVAGIVTIPKVTDRGIRYTNLNFNQLSEKMVGKIRLNDLKLRMTFATKGGGTLVTYVDVVESVGATGAPGKWSFNVPGSPDWDDLFLYHNQDIDHVGAETAKEMWKEGLVLSSARLVDAELNFFHLHDYYMRAYDDRETYRMQELVYDRLVEGLKRSYGIDLKRRDPNNAWTDAYLRAEASGPLASPEDWWEWRKGFSAYLEKISNLPAGLRTGDNHGPYEQAIEDYKKLSQSLEFTYFNFTPAGVDTEALEAGYEPKFDGARALIYSIDYDDIVYVDGGAQHGPYEYAEPFTEDTFVAGTCRLGSTAQTQQRDARSGKTIRSFQAGGCPFGIVNYNEEKKVHEATGDFVVVVPTRSYNIKCNKGLNLRPCGRGAGTAYKAYYYNEDAKLLHTCESRMFTMFFPSSHEVRMDCGW